MRRTRPSLCKYYMQAKRQALDLNVSDPDTSTTDGLTTPAHADFNCQESE